MAAATESAEVERGQEPAPRRPEWERTAGVAAVVTAVLAVLAATVRSTPRWVPTTDWALIEWQVRQIGPHGMPLLGAPSAVGFHHPGPLPYLVLAPLYRLLGTDPRALALATGALAGATVAAIGATAWRRGGLVPTAAAMVVAVWLAGSLPAGTLVDPWNPWVAILPFLWLVVLLWSVLDDDRWALPGAALCASFVVQAHIGYVFPVAALTALTALVLGVRWRHRRRSTTDVRPVGSGGSHTSGIGQGWAVAVVTVAVLGLVWALPLWEQVTADNGNVTRLWAYATDGSAGDRPSLGDSTALAAAEVGWPGPWLTGHEPIDIISAQAIPAPRWRLVVTAAALVLAALAAGRDRSARNLVAVAGVSVASTTVAILLVEDGRAFPYALRLAWPASAAVGLAVVVAGTGWLTRRRPIVAAPMGAVGVAMVVVAGIRLVTGADAAVVPVDRPTQRRQEVACLDQVLPAVRDAVGDGPVHVQQVEWWPAMTGPIVNELDRAGVPVSVDERLGFHLQLPGRPAADGELAIAVVDDAFLPEWEARADRREIARCQLLSADERTELADLVGRDDLTDLERLRAFELLSRSAEMAVFVSRPP